MLQNVFSINKLINEQKRDEWST